MLKSRQVFHQIKSYMKFLWRSKNQHGVHSPFIYNLLTRCFYDRRAYPSYLEIQAYRKEILKNNNTIKVTDFGAGSRVFRTGQRRIAAIGKNAGITSRRARLLNRLVRYLQVENALELGTSLGIGTVAMASGNTVKLTTIEGCPETARIASEFFEKSNLPDIDLRIGEFRSMLSQLKNVSAIPAEEARKGFEPTTGAPHVKRTAPPAFDLVYLDGDHQKEPTLEYFEQLLPHTHNDTLFIFDDIHWSPAMEEAWEVIKAHPSVKVTIDTFFWGLVFFRKEQVKEHFVLRV